MARKMVRKSRKAKKMPMKVQNTVMTGALSPALEAKGDAGATATWWINAAHLMSMMNRKAYHQVDSNGHVKNYGLQIQVFNMVNASTFVYTAAQGYPMENAVRAWHFARKERYEDAGYKLSDLGYGSRLRFALEKGMSDTNQSTSVAMIKPQHLASTVADQGEWDWSDVIITPPVPPGTSSNLLAQDTFDSFVLHLCGDHSAESGGSQTTKFTHVGMIQSWTENTRGWSEPSSEEVIQPENPLAFARLSELSSQILTTEVADEQKQSPPYSNVDDDDETSVFAKLNLAGQLETAFPNPTTNDDIIVAPGGLARVTITNNNPLDVAYPFLSVRIFEL
jgi:hypothetical protein